jgi:hypothetical protein
MDTAYLTEAVTVEFAPEAVLGCIFVAEDRDVCLVWINTDVRILSQFRQTVIGMAPG